MRLCGIITIDPRNIKITVLPDAVLATFVERRAHQHILRGLGQPGLLTLPQQGEIVGRGGVIAAIEVGDAGKVISE